MNLTVTLVDLGRRGEARAYGDRYIATAPPGLYAREIARVRTLLGVDMIRGGEDGGNGFNTKERS